MKRQKLFHKYLCEKRVCASSLTTLKREFRTLRWNIFAKPFCLFIWAQVESFKQKNYRKSHDIVLLRLKEWSFFTYRVDGCSHNHVKVFSLLTIMKVCQMTFLPKTEIFCTVSILHISSLMIFLCVKQKLNMICLTALSLSAVRESLYKDGVFQGTC